MLDVGMGMNMLSQSNFSKDVFYIFCTKKMDSLTEKTLSWFLGCTHKPMSNHLWLSLKVILGLFQTSPECPGTCWHNSFAPHWVWHTLGGYSMHVQTLFETALNWQKPNSQHVINFMENQSSGFENKLLHIIHIFFYFAIMGVLSIW